MNFYINDGQTQRSIYNTTLSYRS